MEKRGQVTIFIIIAVLLIALVAIFFIFRERLGIGGGSFETDSIQTKVISCLEETAEDGINYIGLQGGYSDVPESVSRFYFGEEFAYYYLDSERRIPSIERIESELGDYVEFHLESCINISSFEEQGYIVKRGNISASSNINEGEIRIDVDYPLTLTKGKSVNRMTDFTSQISFNVDRVYSASGELLNIYIANPNSVCLSCLEDISDKYEVQIKSTQVMDSSLNQSDAILFLIIDNENKLNWRFLVEE